MAPQAAKLQSLGDPRRLSEAHPYSSAFFSPDESPPDTFLLASLLFGMVAILFKHRVPAWGALISALCAMANAKGPDNGGFSGLGIALFGFFSAYTTAPDPS